MLGHCDRELIDIHASMSVEKFEKKIWLPWTSEFHFHSKQSYINCVRMLPSSKISGQ